jgi:hypothetical protein
MPINIQESALPDGSGKLLSPASAAGAGAGAAVRFCAASLVMESTPALVNPPVSTACAAANKNDAILQVRVGLWENLAGPSEEKQRCRRQSATSGLSHQPIYSSRIEGVFSTSGGSEELWVR